MIRMRPSQIKVLAGIALSFPGLALAATATTTLSVTASVI